MGTRPGVDGFRRAVWGRVANTTQLTSRLALVTAIGIQPTQIALGVPASRFASIAVNVMMCVPTDSVLLLNIPPLPIAPLMLLVHFKYLSPMSGPCSGSTPVPVNLMIVP